MKKISIKELKKIQIEILDYVADFCEKNKINYWIDSGTLIGAIRHKGFIPWDDDIDIGMLREDFDKFMAIFNKNDSKYKFNCIAIDKNFYYPYGKVLDTDTILYEPSEENGNKIAVNIDVFVYDNAPLTEKEIEKKFKIRNLNRKLNFFRLYKFKNKNILKHIIGNIIHYSLCIFPKGYFAKKIYDNSKKDMYIESDYVGNFSSFSKFTCHKRVFSKFIKKEFEGKLYNVPVGYDEWLRSCYGDYMKLPPKEKRVPSHPFVAYKK